MARRYSKSAGKDVEREMRAFKEGKLRSGPGGKGGKVRSRKQAIAIGLSEARREGKKVPKQAGGSRKKKAGGRRKKRGAGRKKHGARR